MVNKKVLNLKNKIFLLLFIILILCIFYYIYQFFKFDIKVKKFNDEIHIGMTVDEVKKILGKPSQIFIDEYYYFGTFFLREDLILYFNSETEKLIYKKRGYVVVPNPK